MAAERRGKVAVPLEVPVPPSKAAQSVCSHPSPHNTLDPDGDASMGRGN